MSETTWHWIITVQCPISPGVTRFCTRSDTLAPAGGATRSDVYMEVLHRVADEIGVPIGSLTTLFFSLEPNQL